MAAEQVTLERLDDQIAWYSRKSQSAQRRYKWMRLDDLLRRLDTGADHVPTAVRNGNSCGPRSSDRDPRRHPANEPLSIQLDLVSRHGGSAPTREISLPRTSGRLSRRAKRPGHACRAGRSAGFAGKCALGFDRHKQTRDSESSYLEYLALRETPDYPTSTVWLCSALSAPLSRASTLIL